MPKPASTSGAAVAGMPGLPSYGRRRVPGLRRDEVAVLAGVSTDWYIRLERGHIADVSDDVLNAVARALRLDEAERAHLFDLARAARPSRAPRRRGKTSIRPSVQWMLDAMTGAAAFVRNGTMDILAINSLGRALYSPMYARDFFPNWDQAADTTVAIMRTEAGRDPRKPGA
jgi:transcriptional regulator with XRE-family HTH domain